MTEEKGIGRRRTQLPRKTIFQNKMHHALHEHFELFLQFLFWTTGKVSAGELAFISSDLHNVEQ